MVKTLARAKPDVRLPGELVHRELAETANVRTAKEAVSVWNPSDVSGTSRCIRPCACCARASSGMRGRPCVSIVEIRGAREGLNLRIPGFAEGDFRVDAANAI